MTPRHLSWKTIGTRWPSALPSSEYFSVPEDEKNDLSLKGQETRPRSRQLAYLPSVWQFLTLVSLIALCTVATLHIRLRNEVAPRPHIGCGSTIEEARALQCKFDQLAKAWLPPSCPRYGLQEFLDAGYAFGGSNTTTIGEQWLYWKDKYKTQPISIEELSLLATNGGAEAAYWMTAREHMTHCAWMLIRMAYVFAAGERRDLLVSNFPHAKHCALFMLDRGLEGPRVDEVTARGNVVYGSC
ncbi:hypothetical protein F5X97DRAFT_340614 [Nemania serpens]|nr:hypothetical protein F5X97DRAFT_340614 [Nemania serpens]